MNSSVRPIKSLLLIVLEVAKAKDNSPVVRIEHNFQGKSSSALLAASFFNDIP